MKALVVEGTWDPKDISIITQEEIIHKRAINGSQVWRNPQFNITDVPEPSIANNDVLIKVKSCGICGSDSHLYELDSDGYIIFSGPVKFPTIIGHEYSGIIEAVGKDVINLKPGDKVVSESIVWCGKCMPCRSGAFNQCENVELAGITVNGALAEYVSTSALQCWKIDSLESALEDKLFDIAALIEPIGCAYNGMFVNSTVFKPGIAVVIYGVGPIGLGAVALAQLAGARLIIAFDKNPERLAIAKKMGADYTYDISELESSGIAPRDIVMEKTAGYGAEMQVEAAGAASHTLPEMESSLAFNGNIIYLGRAASSAPIILNNLVSGANSIIGSRGHSGYGIYDKIIKLLASKKLTVEEMITSTYSFDNSLEAIKRSVQRTDGKIMVNL